MQEVLRLCFCEPGIVDKYLIYMLHMTINLKKKERALRQGSLILITDNTNTNNNLICSILETMLLFLKRNTEMNLQYVARLIV